MNRWKTVWSGRGGRDLVDEAGDGLLSGMIEADGWDSMGGIDAEPWRAYVRSIAKRIGLKTNQTLFEVGSGAGAFLYPLFSDGYEVAGIDYSEALVCLATNTMKGMDFGVCEAADLDPQQQFDYVLANGVFHYFQSYEYADAVLTRMVDKARIATIILDIPDLELKAEHEEMRKSSLPPGEYEEKYAGLGHLYFERQWFRQFAINRGLDVELWQQDIDGYAQNRFRFNCIIRKVFPR